MRPEYLPFTNDMLPAAGKLLAERHRCDRIKTPLLPIRFEDPQVATKAVESAWQKKSRSGYAAFRDGRMTAYLIGEASTQQWGRCGYVYLPGYALAEDESPEVLQDLYALLGDDWNRTGSFDHYIYLAAAAEVVIDAFFSLGFGRERKDVALDLRTVEFPKPKPPDGFEVRRAGKGDNDRLAGFSSVIARHQALAPRWHPLFPEDLPDLAEGWAELADEPDWTIWLAVDGEESLGSVGFRPLAESDDDMIMPPKATDLTVAAVKESARGRGVMHAVAWHGLKHARDEGYEYCITNWQTANLLAARTWPRFGFEPVAYRLARRVDPMIAWAGDTGAVALPQF